MQKRITKLSNALQKELQQIKDTQELESLRLKYLSKKNGLTIKLLQELPKLSTNDKKKYGPLLNKLKSDQQAAIISKQKSLESQIKHLSPQIDLTLPTHPAPAGHLHPTTIVIGELNDFFRHNGYSIGESRELETAEYNFRKLNLPEGHPATDLQDTLFIEEPDLLLRTHTSSVETRYLTEYDPPMRIAVPGKTYRNETTNSTNGSFFFQYQGFVVDKGVNIQHLKDMLTRVHQFLFGYDIKLRYRYKYYPEVSPGLGVDMQCQFCTGSGCSVCKQRGWIETLGSGMIHYNTLKSCGIDPNIYTGYAFGMGLDRLVMNKFGINDIRKLYGGDLVYK